MNTQHMEDKLLTVEEAALAWAQGKRVQAKPWTDLLGCEWLLIIPVGGGVGHYNAVVFSVSHEQRYIFRLAPEPPAKKFRPYTREELEEYLGRRIQYKHSFSVGILCHVDLHGNGLVGGNWLAASALLDNWEWAGGEPCGVEAGE